MAYLIELPVFQDYRGNLTVVEKVLPFEIKRVYYIYNAKKKEVDIVIKKQHKL